MIQTMTDETYAVNCAVSAEKAKSREESRSLKQENWRKWTQMSPELLKLIM